MCLAPVFEQDLLCKPCSIKCVKTEEPLSQSVWNVQAVTGVFLRPKKRNFCLEKSGSVHIWSHVCCLRGAFKFLPYNFMSSLFWIHFESTFYVVIYINGKWIFWRFWLETVIPDLRAALPNTHHALPSVYVSLLCVFGGIYAVLSLIKWFCSWGPALTFVSEWGDRSDYCCKNSSRFHFSTTVSTVETQLNDSTAAKASLPDVCFSLALLVLFLTQLNRTLIVQPETAFDYFTWLREEKAAVTHSSVCDRCARHDCLHHQQRLSSQKRGWLQKI